MNKENARRGPSGIGTKSYYQDVFNQGIYKVIKIYS